MRSTKRCPKCDGREIIYLPRLVDYQNSAIAAHVESDDWAKAGRVRVSGIMRALVCRTCGFTELYAVAPEKIPIDEIEGAHHVTASQRGPYRE